MESNFRTRVFTPIVLPLAVVGAILVFAWSLAQVLLAVSALWAAAIAVLAAGYVLVMSVIAARTDKISSRAMGVTLAIGLFAVLGAGVSANAVGMREIHHEEEHGAGGEGEEGPPPNTFVAVDIAYEAAPETVEAGAEISFVNEGTAEHNVVIEETGETILEAAPGGGTATATVDLEPGTYTYYCDVPGHRVSMEGQLTVE